jgi:hypothetical protein
MDRGVVVHGGAESQRRTSGIACGLWQLAAILDEADDP